MLALVFENLYLNNKSIIIQKVHIEKFFIIDKKIVDKKISFPVNKILFAKPKNMGPKYIFAYTKCNSISRTLKKFKKI